MGGREQKEPPRSALWDLTSSLLRGMESGSKNVMSRQLWFGIKDQYVRDWKEGLRDRLAVYGP